MTFPLSTSCRARAAVTALALAACLWPVPAGAKTLLGLDEALQLAYPGCEVERTTVFLGEAQLRRAGEIAGRPVDSGVVYPYRATCGGVPGGTAYFDSHRVRTLPETVMVALDADGKVMRVEVLVFREPLDYLPRDLWYRQFDGEALHDELDLKRSIRGVTGATLTARATTEAVRRVLAIHQVLHEPAADQVESTEP